MILLTEFGAGTNPPLQIRNYQLSGDYDNAARLSRSMLLNGGSAFSHFGVTDTDRTFKIDCRFSPEEAARIKSLFELSDQIKIAFWEGFFIGYIYRLTVRRNGEASITFYFKEKIAS